MVKCELCGSETDDTKEFNGKMLCADCYAEKKREYYSGCCCCR